MMMPTTEKLRGFDIEGTPLYLRGSVNYPGNFVMRRLGAIVRPEIID